MLILVLLLCIAMTLDIVFGWDIVQLSAVLRGYEVNTLRSFVERLYPPHRNLYGRANFVPRNPFTVWNFTRYGLTTYILSVVYLVTLVNLLRFSTSLSSFDRVVLVSAITVKCVSTVLSLVPLFIIRPPE